MSNTAPAYLEGFQRIVISVDEISGPDDIKHFVGDHKELTVNPELPVFERHPSMMEEAVSCIDSDAKFIPTWLVGWRQSKFSTLPIRMMHATNLWQIFGMLREDCFSFL